MGEAEGKTEGIFIVPLPKNELDRKDRRRRKGPFGPADRDRKDRAPLRGRSSVSLILVFITTTIPPHHDPAHAADGHFQPTLAPLLVRVAYAA